MQYDLVISAKFLGMSFYTPNDLTYFLKLKQMMHITIF